MKIIKPLSANILRPATDPKQFKFTTTDEIAVFVEMVGQSRALKALQFGTEIIQKGYNLYVIGPTGIGKKTLIMKLLGPISKHQSPPCDWCYVHNFENANKPVALQLPMGLGKKLDQDMTALIEQLLYALPATFESEEYRARIQEIDDEVKEHEAERVKALQAEAEKQEMTILKTTHGYTISPTRDGKILISKDIQQLTHKERLKIEKKVAKLRDRLSEKLADMPQFYKEKHKKKAGVDKKFCALVVNAFIDGVKKQYKDLSQVLSYLSAVQHDIIDNFSDFLKQEQDVTLPFGRITIEKPSLTRYKVNVLVSHDHEKGSPIVFLDHPNYPSLVGRLGYRAQFGVLISDFTMIKSGALHQANGGYLIIDALKILTNPYTWSALKRILITKKIKIEPVGQMLGLADTIPIEPEPIPIDMKIILLGDHSIFNILGELDAEFKKLFKVAVYFETRIERNIENNRLYAQLIAKIIQDNGLNPFHRNAVAQIMDYCARFANDSKYLSLHMQSLVDMLRESHYWSRKENKKIVRAKHVQQAVDAKIERVDYIRERLYQAITDNSILIDVKSEKIGQVNAISIIEQADFVFGQPSKITATVRLGSEGIIDIEREVDLGGAIHSKGVLILSGFLKGRYAKEHKLSLTSSLVFEQSYGMVEGDSASVAELCALLSALADAPIKQSLAITGSVNQHGQVQAIGLANEKIEGFFDICKLKGLTGQQGVLIPATNVKNLILRQDVVDAVAANKFNVYPITTIDEAIAMLTGVFAGKRDKRGNYQEGSINYRVEACLQKFAEELKKEQKGKK